MERLATGLRLVRGCLAVVRAVPALVLPGVVHALAVLAIAAAFFLVLRSGDASPASLGVLLLAILLPPAVGTVCAAVVVAVTADRMAGGTAGLREGVRVAVAHLPALLLWSLLSATVGTLLRAVEERLGPVGRWVTAGAGAAFALGTLLVVPVLVVEGGSPRRALGRSARLFRARWGESVVGSTGLGLVLGLVLLAAVVLVVCPLLAVGQVPALVAVVVLLAAHAAVSSTSSAVLSAAVHRVAVGGDGGPFGDLSALFAPRPRAYPPAYAAPHGQWDAS